MPKMTRSKKTQDRVDAMWEQRADFGREQDPKVVFVSIIANRYALVKGAQLIRDELQMSFNTPSSQRDGFSDDALACACDLEQPSVLTTCGYTMCGDRICQSESLRRYQSMVAGRFGSMTEGGDVKPELFFATGGGTDSGPTLAHVTVGHALDPSIKRRLYDGNKDSSFLVNLDVCTHCGHLDVGEHNSLEFQGKEHKGVGAIYGLAQESMFRDPRPCCGAIVGMLTSFNLQNNVHRRLRADLGEANWNYLSSNEVLADDGSPVKFLIAAAIVAVQGMRNTLEALGPGGELDERGVGHMTAQVQMNNVAHREGILYCARATVFNGEIREQGLGTDAAKYSAVMDKATGGLRLLYDGTDAFPVQSRSYAVVRSTVAAVASGSAEEHAVDVQAQREAVVVGESETELCDSAPKQPQSKRNSVEMSRGPLEVEGPRYLDL